MGTKVFVNDTDWLRAKPAAPPTRIFQLSNGLTPNFCCKVAVRIFAQKLVACLPDSIDTDLTLLSPYMAQAHKKKAYMHTSLCA